MNARSTPSAGGGRHPAARRAGDARRSAVLACAALTAASLTAVPASASMTGNGVRPGSSVMVMHNIDFVAVGGYGPLGRPVTVQVLRNGVPIGSARGPAIDAEGAPGLEVNHGPEGAARPGDCFDGHTPDIRPGDVIRITDARGTDEITVDDLGLVADSDREDPLTGDVLVDGWARTFDGQAMPLTALDSAEYRDGSAFRVSADEIVLEQRPAEVGGFTMRIDVNQQFARNRDNRTPDRIRDTLLSVDGYAVGFGHVEPAPADAQLAEGMGDGSGPAPGCESAPGASEGVTSVTPAVINGRTPANRSVVVGGFSTGAGTVDVTLTDSSGASQTAEATVTGTDAQSWRATFSPAQLAGLDGVIRVTASIDGTQSDTSKTLLKDVTAPDAPAASIPAGTYRGVQRVALSAAAGDQIRYTLGSGRQAAPTATRGRLYRGGQIRIARSQTLKMVAVDEARNVSAVSALRYRILGAPSRPRAVRARTGAPGGPRTAVVRWVPPARVNGSAVRGYRVLALKMRANGSVASRRVSAVLTPRARSLRMRLPVGLYRFQVRAINGLGGGPLSARSNAVRPR